MLQEREAEGDAQGWCYARNFALAGACHVHVHATTYLLCACYDLLTMHMLRPTYYVRPTYYAHVTAYLLRTTYLLRTCYGLLTTYDLLTTYMLRPTYYVRPTYYERPPRFGARPSTCKYPALAMRSTHHVLTMAFCSQALTIDLPLTYPWPVAVCSQRTLHLLCVWPSARRVADRVGQRRACGAKAGVGAPNPNLT